MNESCRNLVVRLHQMTISTVEVSRSKVPGFPPLSCQKTFQVRPFFIQVFTFMQLLSTRMYAISFRSLTTLLCDLEKLMSSLISSLARNVSYHQFAEKEQLCNME